MEQDLISKRDLLEQTGISYGQLYRWKRKQLIPEEWFVRKSTFTGQETFFPRRLILERIAKIKGMKDERSLDELAGVFSPSPPEIALSLGALAERRIVSRQAADVGRDVFGAEELDFPRVFLLYLFDRALRSGDVGAGEGRELLEFLRTRVDEVLAQPAALVGVRKWGVAIWCLVTPPAVLHFDPQAKLLLRETIAERVEELKLMLEEGGGGSAGADAGETSH